MTIDQIPRLYKMLSWMRPHGSNAEELWIKQFLGPYNMTEIPGAAYVHTIPLPDGSASTTLFSAHTDTMHATDGHQTIFIDPEKQVYHKLDGKPLGADDGAGCWLLLEMIDAGVPGTYAFHRGEERGGIGSSFVAEQCREWLGTFQRAIAFDRRGTTDVITHQFGGRCCSDKFAQALADALNAGHDDFMYLPDDTGSFTDTANYTDVISECTNVSVGYQNEHSGRETLYLPHLYALRTAVLKVDWESLPAARDPNEIDYGDYGSLYGGFGREQSYIEFRSEMANVPSSPSRVERLTGDHIDPYELYDYQLQEMTRSMMVQFARFDPDSFVDAVQTYMDDMQSSRYKRRYYR